MSDMDKLAEMVAALTPGPWLHCADFRDASYAHIQTADRGEVFIAGDMFPCDALGITALRNVAPELIAVVKAPWDATARDALDAKLAEVLGD